jgi:hypothetical protein
MQIDLNNQHDFAFSNVRKLLASGRNDIDMQVRVSRDGIAFLSDVTGADEIDEVSFRLHTMDAGNEFIGPSAEAASDDIVVAQVYRRLKNNWPNPTSAHADVEPYEFVKLNQ